LSVNEFTGVFGSGNTITVTQSPGSNVDNVNPTVEVSPGADYSPKGGQSFTSGPVKYTVTAADGVTTKDYWVTVTTALFSTKDITAFKLSGVDGVISENSITVTLPYGSSRTSLSPTVTHTGVSYSPTSAQNFSTSKIYTVTAEDSTTKNYTVTVAKNSEKKILSLKTYRSAVSNQTGSYDSVSINEQNKTISISPNSNWTTDGCYVTLTVSTGATVSWASPVKWTSANSRWNIPFGTSKAYCTVTAEDESSVTYTVTINDYDGGS
jgi:hypothetical protein